MDLNWIWKTVVVFIIGTFVLRIGGKKSIAQMTTSQTIVIIGLGTLLVEPISSKGLLPTFFVSLVLVIMMIITEYMGLKSDFLETILDSKAVIVIENGKPNIKNLKKLRMSIDSLEARLRQAGISSIEDVKYATIEVSGELGYELMDNKKPLTQEDFSKLMNEISALKSMVIVNTNSQANEGNNIFEEIRYKRFEGNKKEP